MTIWYRFDQFLNSRRMSYAWIAGGILWAAWMLSSLLGHGNMDLAGQVIGTDYIQFYAAGTTLRQGQSPELYNFAFQGQLELSIAGPALNSFHAFLTPPFFAWLYVPLSFLPYTWSFILWSLLGLLFIWASLKLLESSKPVSAFLWSLTWFPVFAAISFGQNSLLSLLLFSLTYWLWRKDKALVAGLISSLLLFKPQMILGLGLLWLLEWRQSWKSLLGLFLGGSALTGLCFWLLPEASRAYIALVRNFLPVMMYQDQFPLWHLHSIRGFLYLLLPQQVSLVEVISLILSLTGIAAFIYFWRKKRAEKKLLFAAAICLTIWITPHAMIYDWSILLIPAILLWQEFTTLRPVWKALFALMWIAMFISGPLTYLQLKILPVAVQISIPVFLLTIICSGKLLIKNPIKDEYFAS